jgi:hypothetical protein
MAALPEAEITEPERPPPLCDMPRDGFWPTECWALLDKYDIVAWGNYNIAQGNTDALRKTEEAYSALIQGGKYQQELAKFREELLLEERNQRSQDKWFYRVAIVGLVAIMGVAL